MLYSRFRKSLEDLIPIFRIGNKISARSAVSIGLTLIFVTSVFVVMSCVNRGEKVGDGPTSERDLEDRALVYRRPYGDAAPWNVPVANLRRHLESENLVALLWESTLPRSGNFNLSFDDYTYPVYSISEATRLSKVQTLWTSNLDGTKIPWNPDWRPAPGSDAQVILIDEATGREWNLFQVSAKRRSISLTNGNLVPGDFRTRTNGYAPSRGVGIPYLAMLVRPEEVAAGQILHALSMPANGTSGVYSVPPALKLERNHGKPGIPQGTRFALDVSDQEIEEWIRSLDRASEATKRSARIIARALRDYGWFITDSAGSSHFQFEANVSAGEDWAQLGLSNQGTGDTVYPRDLLDGLLIPERIYALVPSDAY